MILFFIFQNDTHSPLNWKFYLFKTFLLEVTKNVQNTFFPMELLLPLFRWKKYLQESESIFLRIISIQGIQCKSAASASESNLEQIKGVSKMIWSLFQQLEFGTEGDQSILNTTWYPQVCLAYSTILTEARGLSYLNKDCDED